MISAFTDTPRDVSHVWVVALSSHVLGVEFWDTRHNLCVRLRLFAMLIRPPATLVVAIHLSEFVWTSTCACSAGYGRAQDQPMEWRNKRELRCGDLDERS